MITFLDFRLSLLLLSIIFTILNCAPIDGHRIQKRKHLTFVVEVPEEVKYETEKVNLKEYLERTKFANHLEFQNEIVYSKWIEKMKETEKGSSESVAAELNLRPIVGILSQDLGKSMEGVEELNNYTSYIAASYVKFVESAGARVVPILINQDDKYYEQMANSLNGFLFPGGSLPITNESGYGRAGKKIFDLVIKASNIGKPLALWTTCLGFEMLLYLASDGDYTLSNCSANNRADKLIFDSGYKHSKLFGKMSDKIIQDFQTKNITSNFHTRCVLPEIIHNTILNKTMKILSTSMDDFGVEYVSTVEHKNLPIFGTQWHPEKAPFEWANDKHHNSISHDLEAVRASYALAEVFVQETRKNRNQFDSEDAEKKSLIYNYQPIYVQPLYGSSFEQCYYFN